MKGGYDYITMEKAVQMTLIIVLGVVVLGSFAFVFFDANVTQKETVVGNGVSNIEVTPDLVKVYFNVQTSGETSEEATDANSEIVEDLKVNLIYEGFNREDIQTRNFNVYPKYDWVNGQRKEKGYEATHSLVVEMPASEYEKIGKAVDAGVEVGAGVSYINFELSDEKQKEYKTLALTEATEDARTKAQAIASGLGMKLGDVVSVSDDGWGYYPVSVYSGSGMIEDNAIAKEAATDIQPADQNVNANVRVVFELK